MERTLVILKPCCLQRGLIGEVISRFEKRGLKLVAMKMVQLDEEILKVHYAHLLDKPFFPWLRDGMMAAPVILCCWEGFSAVQVVRDMAGATKGSKAIPGTIGLDGQKQAHNFQITGVWNLDFFNHWLSFNGFADFWRETRVWQNTSCIFISEPQLWVNLKNIKGWEKVNLSVGTEVELSYNFFHAGFKALPTVALKWTF